MKKTNIRIMASVGALALSALAVQANNYSFTGSFSADNNVQTFNFTVGASSPNVILETLSYAGGVNSAGQTIAAGGFDPILALFDSTGALIGQNDDGGGSVPADPTTGAHYDTYLSVGTLAAGTYTVSVMQYNNFAVGSNLSQGFRYDAAGNQAFTESLTGHSSGLFWDVTGHERTGNWAFDILNVSSANQNGGGGTPTPDAAQTLGLLGSALAGLVAFRKQFAK